MIAEVLNRGAENGISMQELARRLQCNERELRQRVHEERVEGAAILSGNTGYYLPSEDPQKAIEELKAFEKRLNAKAVNTFAAIKSAKAARIRLENMLKAFESAPDQERPP